MMIKHFLLATSAIVLLVLPNVSFAQPGHDTAAGSDKKNERPVDQGRSGPANPQAQARPQRQAAPQAQANPQAQARPQRQAAPQAPANPQVQARPQRQASPQAQANPQVQARPQRQAAPQAQANPQVQARPQRQAAPQAQANPQVQARPHRQAAPQAQARVQVGRPVPNQTARAATHVQQATQWRSTNPNWNSRTLWQRDPNWWHGNASFSNYNGVRLNFFFAPGYGYYSVSQQYQGRRWHPGEYLPSFFLRYVVRNYRSYGLPAPPDGASWVWVNTSVLLVDRDDGYILDEVDNVWWRLMSSCPASAVAFGGCPRASRSRGIVWPRFDLAQCAPSSNA